MRAGPHGADRVLGEYDGNNNLLRKYIYGPGIDQPARPKASQPVCMSQDPASDGIEVAPINRDSGTFRGKRMTGAGRRNVRSRLYMPTLVALRHNSVIRRFYQHLLSKGKTKMTAIIAGAVCIWWRIAIRSRRLSFRPEAEGRSGDT